MSFVSNDKVNWIERRTSLRKQLSAKGWIHLDGRRYEVRTFDASQNGVGIDHDEVIPCDVRASLALGLLTPQGRPAVLQAVVRVCHSHLSVSGRWRSGLQFLHIEQEHKQLLDTVLKAKMQLYELAVA